MEIRVVPTTINERKRGRVVPILPEMLVCRLRMCPRTAGRGRGSEFWGSVEIADMLKNCEKQGELSEFCGSVEITNVPENCKSGGRCWCSLQVKCRDYQHARKLGVGACQSVGEFPDILKSGGWALDRYFTV